MLTREQARQRPCPYMIAFTTPECHQNGDGEAYTTYEYAKCVAEDCPKWVDEGIGIDEGLICPKAPKCDKYNGGIAFVCNKYSQRYGRCGG